MDNFFNAESVAVIGASRTPGKVGYSILNNFSKNFKGKIYPVNPKADKILGHKCYSKVTEIKNSVDLAVIAVPAKLVSFVLHECAVKGVKSAVVVTGGFSEIGRNDLQDEIKDLIEKTDINVIGPNCIGIFDPYSNIDTLFLPEFKLKRPKKGKISIITQSGAVGSIMLDWMAGQGFGISKFISYGNAIDINEVDALEYLGSDKNTEIICMYLEGTQNGKKLIEVAKKVSKKKPIIVVKGGTTKEGSKAVSSHTGSLAGDDLIWNAAFEKAGLIRAEGLIEMFDYARVLLEQPVAKGPDIQIVTNGGGFGVLATDEIIKGGFKLANMQKSSVEKLKKELPSHAVIGNPLDLVGDATYKEYNTALDTLEKDKKVDAILCIILFQTAGMSSKVIDVVSDFSKSCKTPIVVCSAGGDFTQRQVKEFNKRKIPVFDTPIRAVNALTCLARYGRIIR